MAKKKWKKRIKKALKGAAIAGGALLAAKALSGRGRTAAANVDSGRGSGLRETNVKTLPGSTYKHKDDIMKFPNRGAAIGVDYDASPFERSQVAPYIKGIDRSPIDRRPPSRWDTGAFDTGDMSGAGVAAKSGGRIVKTKSGVGIAKRGFGRALGRGKK